MAQQCNWINVNEDGADSILEAWLQEDLDDKYNDRDSQQAPGPSSSRSHVNEDLQTSDIEDGEYLLSDHDTNSSFSESSSNESDLPLSELVSHRSRNDAPAQDNSSYMSDDDQSIPEQTNQNYYHGKDRTKWSRLPPTRNVRTAAHNIVQVPRVRPLAEGPLSPIDAFQLLFDQRMLNIILTWTNKKL